MAHKQIIFDTDYVGGWVCDRVGGAPDKHSTAIGLLGERGELIAGVLFDKFNGRSVCMHVAAEPGARWMTRQYLWMCFDYPFNQMRVRKILGLVDSTNHQARKFDEHLGFIPECSIKDAGKYGDLLIYSMTRLQCRFIRERNGKQIGSATTA